MVPGPGSTSNQRTTTGSRIRLWPPKPGSIPPVQRFPDPLRRAPHSHSIMRPGFRRWLLFHGYPLSARLIPKVRNRYFTPNVTLGQDTRGETHVVQDFSEFAELHFLIGGFEPIVRNPDVSMSPLKLARLMKSDACLAEL